MAMARSLFLAAVLGLTLAACGTSQTERGVSGGLLGAAGGAGIGAMTGTSTLGGAVLGGAAGAATGILTAPKKDNN
jgi:osmotically inducible lipoprotein OsmB